MPKVEINQLPHCVTIRGRLGFPYDLHRHPERGIYQQRKVQGRKVNFKMKFYQPPPSRTPAQAARRDLFKAAVLAWQGLSQEVKQQYNLRARKKVMSGYNLFLSQQLNG